MRKATLNLSPPLLLVQAEAEAMGVPFTALLTADIVRFRRLGAAAMPKLDEWQWGLLSHVLESVEELDILRGIVDLPSAGSIAAAINQWSDGATDEDMIKAVALRKHVVTWSPLAIAGVLLRLRSETARTRPNAKK